MAFYDLRCDDCGNEFEKFVTGFLTDGDKVCPKCNSRRVVQIFNSSFGIGGSFSGGGGCAPSPSGGFG